MVNITVEKKQNEIKKKYEKYPLHKSHSKYGFIEPIKYFNPSIGISQIIGLDKKTYQLLQAYSEERPGFSSQVLVHQAL